MQLLVHMIAIIATFNTSNHIMVKENKNQKEADLSIQPSPKFSFKIYIKDIKWNLALCCLALIGIFVLFYSPIQSIFHTIFVQTVLKSCPQNSYAVDFVVFCFFVYAAIFFVRQYRRGLAIVGNSVIFILTIAFIYFAFFREDPLYNFYFFHIKRLNGVAYWDVLVVAFLLLIATYKSYKEPLAIPPTRYSFIDDTPSLVNYVDGYSRAGYAKEITFHINKTTTESSFAIGIIGEWGSGKTDFLMRLKQDLKENTDNHVFDFNPWRVSKPEAIIEEFFKTLSTEIKPFNQSITGKIKDYSKRILQTGKEIQYRFFDTLLNEWIGDENIEKQYLTINKAISNTSKRWVIVIDDADRLTGKEIMEVLRIIRNTANFGNTFFIIAIDQRYIINALKNTKEFANEEEYLKKVFQLTITLPSFKKQVFIPQLKNLLITKDLTDSEQIAINGALSKISTDFGDVSVAYFPIANHDDVLEKMIENARDLKRFANSFKIAFNILSGEVDIHDLMVLELLRNRNLEVYNLIRDRSLLDFNIDRSSEFRLNEKAFEDFAQSRKHIIPDAELEKLKAVVTYLVTDEGYKNSRKFMSSSNFYLYFAYQLFDLISLKEFNDLLGKTSSDISTTFTKWLEGNKRSELFRVVAQVTDFPDAHFFIKIIIAYLNIKVDHDFWLQLVEKLIFSLRQFNAKKYFGNDLEKHKKFLVDFMDNDEIAATDRASIAAIFLYEHNHGKSKLDLILSKAEWTKILTKLLDLYLNQSSSIDNNALTLLRQIVDHIDADNRVTLAKPAVARFKKALSSNKRFFEDYTGMLLRPFGEPYHGKGQLVIEPFLEQIFGDWKIFKRLLQKTTFTDKSTQRLKEIVLIHIDDFYNSGKTPFKISDRDDSEFIDKWMVDHGTAKIIS